MIEEPVFVIAEAGVNHNGDLALALRLCEAAYAAGADAVKFQTFRAEDLVVPGAPTAEYQRRETGEDDQFRMLRALELSAQQHVAIQAHCAGLGIEFFSTPFSLQALRLLLDLGVRRLKMSSGELTHRPLMEAAAASGLPLLVSTGMATVAEIHEALVWVRTGRGHLREVSLLHCTSAYPAPDEALHLRAITAMRREFGLPVGYSDHSEGIEASVAAVALGASVIEKHLTLDCNLPGPDHRASLEPSTFAALVRGIRRVQAMRGEERKAPGLQELQVARVARRSVFAAVDIAAGATITPELLACRRPGTGIAPSQLGALVGRVACVPIAAGSVLEWAQFEPAAGPGSPA